MTDSSSAGLSPRRYQLTHWQAERLAASYADLRADPRYAAATRFFLEDLYGPYDFSKRDREGERIVATMHKMLPASAVRPLERALQLNRLTRSLDDALEQMLFVEMGVEQIDLTSYCEAYRRCDNLAARIEQIEEVDVLGRELDRVVRKPLVQLALRMARGPAHLAGLGELQDFLERGFAAFLAMGHAAPFLEQIKRRELIYLDRINARDPDPFRVIED
ncbi:FFLEELY motif protein [Chitinimonas lacunae]|uniref:DUF8198 domain-containing protein n=1 Tax=Chitinimonas lacunae TaxID=1963018 RepID=A0ABV8MLB1_9NEIS